MAEPQSRVSALTHYITDEIIKALGFSDQGWIRKVLGPVFYTPARRFSQVAADFEADLEIYGFNQATKRLLTRFAKQIDVRGVENIPSEGPLLVASNHPGTYDSVAISASLAREDLKIIATGVPFVQELKIVRQHLIYATRETYDRMLTVRNAIRHLRAGGALLIFPSGVIDPDPAVIPGASAALDRWSASLEIFLRQAPDTQLLLSIVSGVLSPTWIRNPLVHLRKQALDQRRLAEFFQIMQQMLFPKLDLRLSPKVTFAPPISVEALRSSFGTSKMLNTIIEEARTLLAEHCELYACQLETA